MVTNNESKTRECPYCKEDILVGEGRDRTMSFRLLTTLLVFASPTMVQAEQFELPPQGNDVIGAVAVITARADDTLLDIARRHGLGYEDIVRANPDVDTWLPGEGTEVLLPTRYVLPSGSRKGVILNLAEYRMYYFPEPKDGEPAVVMTYPMSIGRMDWETPLGLARVVVHAVFGEVVAKRCTSGMACGCRIGDRSH